MGGVCQVRADATMGTVRASAHLNGALALHVLDDELVSSEGLVLLAASLSVCYHVLKQVDEVLGGLGGESYAVAGRSDELALLVAPAPASVAAHSDTLGAGDHLLQVCDSLVHPHATDVCADLSALLVVDAEPIHASARHCG